MGNKTRKLDVRLTPDFDAWMGEPHRKTLDSFKAKAAPQIGGQFFSASLFD